MSIAGASSLPQVIIVSPQFPPSTLAGVHRARHLAKHLPSAGWEPTVVCVDEAYHEGHLDPALDELVARHTRRIRTGALPVRFMRPLGIGDLGLRAYRQLRRTVLDLVRQRRADVVLITGAPYYPMLMAGALRARGVPVVLDFQDPWVSRWGANQTPFSKAGLSHRLGTWLEPRVLAEANFITSVSEVQNRQLMERHAWLDHTRLAAIPIGGDPLDFAHLRRRPCSLAAGLLAEDRINLSFVGTFADRFVPAMCALLAGARRLRNDDAHAAQRIRLNFIGTSAQMDEAHVPCRVRALAEDAGIAEMVYEFPRRLPYLDALSVMARSDGLLLIGSDEPHYTASRVLPALMSDRPYLSLYHADSSANAILKAAGGGIALTFSDEDDLRQSEAAIGAALRTLAFAPAECGSADPAAYAAHTARSVAGRFGAIFDQLTMRRCASVAGRANSIA